MGASRFVLLSLVLSCLGATPADQTRTPDAWYEQLVQWQSEYREAVAQGDKQKAEEIREKVRAIRDPNARSALVRLSREVNDRQDEVNHRGKAARDTDARVKWQKARDLVIAQDLRPFYLEALVGIGGPETFDMLVRLTIDAQTPDIANTAIRLIRESQNPKDALPILIRYLRSRDHAGRAAYVLRATGLSEPVSMADTPDPVLTKALIDAIIEVKKTYTEYLTYHERFYNGGGGWPFGYEGWSERHSVPIYYGVPNRDILYTLIEYTGQDFGYDKRRWYDWYNKEVRRNTGK